MIDVTINTKYDIGDTLYRVVIDRLPAGGVQCNYCGNFVKHGKPCEVREERINGIHVYNQFIDNKTVNRNTIFYTTTGEIGYDLSEKSIDTAGRYHFSTREGAQAECDRLNGKRIEE